MAQRPAETSLALRSMSRRSNESPFSPLVHVPIRRGDLSAALWRGTDGASDLVAASRPCTNAQTRPRCAAGTRTHPRPRAPAGLV